MILGVEKNDTLLSEDKINPVYALGGKGDDTIFGYIGDDDLYGNEGADLITPGNGVNRVFGGKGIDTVVIDAKKINFTISSQSAQFQIFSGLSEYDVKAEFKNSLSGIERIKFTDGNLAIDFGSQNNSFNLPGSQNAAIVSKILGAVFGKDSVSNKSYVGIGLHFLDSGWTYDNLAGLALDVTGAKTNDQIVSLLWANVIGSKPTTADKQPFIALLENGMTAGALAHLAADTSFNTTNINLIGLAQTGIEDLPIS